MGHSIYKKRIKTDIYVPNCDYSNVVNQAHLIFDLMRGGLPRRSVLEN